MSDVLSRLLDLLEFQGHVGQHEEKLSSRLDVYNLLWIMDAIEDRKEIPRNVVQTHTGGLGARIIEQFVHRRHSALLHPPTQARKNQSLEEGRFLVKLIIEQEGVERLQGQQIVESNDCPEGEH